MNRFVFMFAMLVLLCATAASAETVWDAVTDFGVAAQLENGVWRYGYGVGATGFGGYFDLAFGTNTEGGWTRSMGGSPDYSPYMWCNRTGTAGTYPAYSLNLSSGLGGDDYHTFVRWIAPADGWYQVDSCYQMMAAAGGGYWTGEMDVSTVVNGTVIYADFVSGYDYYSLHPEWGWPTYDPGPKPTPPPTISPPAARSILSRESVGSMRPPTLRISPAARLRPFPSRPRWLCSVRA